jgi:hypothetical protein
MSGACPDSNPLLEAALSYAERGWKVFPVRPGSKAPPLTPHGLKDATTDPAAIRKWWGQWPDANVAIATGPGSKLLVVDIDVDPEKGVNGLSSMEDLEAVGCAFPETLAVRTPRGGLHLYYAYDGAEIGNSAGKVAPGIDIRGTGGYVLAPPSVIR